MRDQIYQSQRFDIYRQAARQLVSLGQAYYCFCTPEEIEKDGWRPSAVVSTGNMTVIVFIFLTRKK